MELNDVAPKFYAPRVANGGNNLLYIAALMFPKSFDNFRFSFYAPTIPVCPLRWRNHLNLKKLHENYLK